MGLYKMTEWESGSGTWHCNNVEDLANGSGYWWLPARMLDLSPAKYVEKVIKDFKPDEVYHNQDCSFVGWCWEKQSDERKFKNWINAEARKRQFYI